ADVTRGSGLDRELYGIGAAAADFDNDGRVDVYVTALGGNRLFRNSGGGKFVDVTRAAGVGNGGFSTSALWFDYDGDGWLDLFVANDTQPNRLFRNKGNGTFTDVAMGAGVAFSEAGVARAGMGVDAADYDGSGRPSVIIGNFSNEMMALYHNEGTGL